MKIGIITMHKVLNFGSALQAYALQKILNNYGYDNEIIDYDFPPHKSFFERFMYTLRFWFYQLRTGTLHKRAKIRYFAAFYKQNFRLSQKRYNQQTITGANDIYDAFITGSDQVWNPTWTKDDTTFLLSFAAENKPRCSYASSFAVDHISDSYRCIYKRYLSRYQRISVREKSGVNIVKNLIKKNPDVVLDPTLLLTNEDYKELSKQSRLHIEGSYILVYMLGYMYDPFPEVNHIVRLVHERLGGKVVYMNTGKYTVYRKDCICVEHLGPCEFVSLIENASFVITSSFHGTAFASIFNKPLLSTVKSLTDTDGRMPSLLKQIGGEQSIIEYNATNVDLTDINRYRCSLEDLEKQRKKSIAILLDNMNVLSEYTKP